MQYEKWVLEIVAKHYQVSISEAIELSLIYNLEMQNANKELEKAYKEKWNTISIS